MKTHSCIAVLLWIGLSGTIYGADGDSRPRVGEIRALALAPENGAAVAQLHDEGWVEARGQLLDVDTFPDLFKTVGRTWTSERVARDHFGIPDLDHTWQAGPSLNRVEEVMGPGDLITGGRRISTWLRQSPVSYWIYTGRHVGDQAARRVRSR